MYVHVYYMSIVEITYQVRWPLVESVELIKSVATTDIESIAYAGWLKRSIDIVIAALSLICVAPLLLVAFVLITLESPGSPIFTQVRVGQNGRHFKIFKLRTMFSGSDKLHYKTEPLDSRLTKVGAILRQMNIDELPQLINILIGDMSIIGPRPLSVTETEFLVSQAAFSKETPGLVPTFRPGLVGLEQVNRSSNLTYAQRFEFNNNYESNWSLAMDFKILLKAMRQCSSVCAVVVLGAIFIFFGSGIPFKP